MENLLDNNIQNSQNLQLDANALNHLNETRKWTFFISIVGFIGIGLMFMVGVVMLFASSAFMPSMGYASTLPAAASGLIMLVFLVLYFFPIYYLMMFSKHSKAALMAGDPFSLSLAFKYLKMHYRFMGILLIIVLGIYALIFVGALVAGGIGLLMR